MLILGSAPVDGIADGILRQTPSEGFSGELGGGFGVLPLIPILVGGGALILGGGTLWHLHERHTEKEAYQDCLSKFTRDPYNMPPAEAALACTGEVKPKGFKFGLNAPTFIVVAGGAFGLWFMTQLMIAAAKK
jgi:hypothetical protein